MNAITKWAMGAVVGTLLTLPAQAAFPNEKWCGINNKSTKDVVVTIADFKLTVGDVYLKPADSKSDGDIVKLSTHKDNYTLKATKRYLAYFDDGLTGTLALSLRFGSGKDSTEMNFKRAPGLGDRLVVLPAKTLSRSNVLMDFSCFRRNRGDFVTLIDAPPEPKKGGAAEPAAAEADD